MQTSIDAAHEEISDNPQPRTRPISGEPGGLALAMTAGAAAAAADKAQGARQRTMATDLAARAMGIHWPTGFEPERADLFAHNETVVEASCETVWQHIVDARAWPQWYPNARGVQLLSGAGALAPDVRWRWTTFDLAIESRVHEFVPNRRLGWFGGAPGETPAFYHSWLLAPEGDGCRVTMDEAGVGSGAAAFRRADEARMHRGHALWLATLKWVSEGR
jgi:uncharacterized protein YndB with AHSA1/START domain